jgi:hypothetical protein
LIQPLSGKNTLVYWGRITIVKLEYIKKAALPEIGKAAEIYYLD